MCIMDPDCDDDIKVQRKDGSISGYINITRIKDVTKPKISHLIVGGKKDPTNRSYINSFKIYISSVSDKTDITNYWNQWVKDEPINTDDIHKKYVKHKGDEEDAR